MEHTDHKKQRLEERQQDAGTLSLSKREAALLMAITAERMADCRGREATLYRLVRHKGIIG